MIYVCVVFLQDMYFKYIWNNFLHIQVEICTAMILAMPPAQSETPEINRDQDQEPVRENHLIKHVRTVIYFFPVSFVLVFPLLAINIQSKHCFYFLPFFSSFRSASYYRESWMHGVLMRRNSK